MLTPEQVKKHHFRSAGKGLYKSDEVDEYLAQVAESFEQASGGAAELQKSNDELYQRVEALANALNQLRAERELIQKTMILAQKSADELTSHAQEESARLLREAKEEAERQRKAASEEAEGLVAGAQREVDKRLLESQARAENILAQSKAKADSLFDEARSKAQQELIRISTETQREEQAVARLRQEGARFRNHLIEAVTQQMEFIEKLPFDDDGQPEPLPAEPAQAEPEPEPDFQPPPDLQPEPEPEPALQPPSDLLAELDALDEPVQERIYLEL
ncbi:MAG: DivIVA domain-containing protein [Oscillospiraceae bacterium]|jgi:cell division initiation protein|nr:DivIVA domain-containing protein [Oscillospiraceae bacterium]